MVRPNRRRQQARRASEGKRSLKTINQNTELSAANRPDFDEIVSDEYVAHVHWEGLEADDEPEIDGLSEPEDNAAVPESDSAFDRISDSSTKKDHLRYYRGAELSDRQKRRKKAGAKEMEKDARENSQSIVAMFAKVVPQPAQIRLEGEWEMKPQQVGEEQRKRATKELEDTVRRLFGGQNKSKGPNWVRHHAVLTLLNSRAACPQGESTESLALHIAWNYRKGKYFSRLLVQWEKQWMQNRTIPEDKRGRHAKTLSWLNDEGVLLEVRELIATMSTGTYD